MSYTFGRPRKKAQVQVPMSQPQSLETGGTPIIIPSTTDYSKYTFYLIVLIVLLLLGFLAVCWMKGGVPVKVR